jgi:hypothetical protein
MKLKTNFLLIIAITCVFLFMSSFFDNLSAKPSPSPTAKSKTSGSAGNSDNEKKAKPIPSPEEPKIQAKAEIINQMHAVRGKSTGFVKVSRQKDLKDNITMTIKGLPVNRTFYVGILSNGKVVGFGKDPFCFKSGDYGMTTYIVENYNSEVGKCKYFFVYLVKDGNVKDRSADNLVEYMKAQSPDFALIGPRDKGKKPKTFQPATLKK